MLSSLPRPKLRQSKEINLFSNEALRIPRSLINHKLMPIKLKAELYDPRVALEDADTIEARYYLPKGYKIVNGKIAKISKPILRN